MAEAEDVARVFFGVVADVGSSGGGDVAGDAVALRLGVEVDLEGFGGQPLGDDDLELVGPLVEQADGEVVEVHQVLGVLDDLVLEQLEAFGGGELGDGVGVDLGQLTSGGVDGVDLALQPLAAGGVPDHGDDLLHASLLVEGGGADQLEVAVVGLEGELAAAVGGALVEGARLGGEDLQGLPADASGLLEDAGLEPPHLRVRPDDPPVVVHDADAFADGVEHERRPVADQSPFEWEEVAHPRDDRFVVPLAQHREALLGPLGAIDIQVVARQGARQLGGVLVAPGLEDQDAASLLGHVWLVRHGHTVFPLRSLIEHRRGAS